MTELGDFLRKTLEARGLSQAAVARKAGCTSGYLSMVVAGSRKPTPPMIRRIGDAMGLSAEEIKDMITKGAHDRGYLY